MRISIWFYQTVLAFVLLFLTVSEVGGYPHSNELDKLVTESKKQAQACVEWREDIERLTSATPRRLLGVLTDYPGTPPATMEIRARFFSAPFDEKMDFTPLWNAGWCGTVQYYRNMKRLIAAPKLTRSFKREIADTAIGVLRSELDEPTTTIDVLIHYGLLKELADRGFVRLPKARLQRLEVRVTDARDRVRALTAKLPMVLHDATNFLDLPQDQRAAIARTWYEEVHLLEPIREELLRLASDL